MFTAKKQKPSAISQAIKHGDNNAPANHRVSIAWDRHNCEWNAWFVHERTGVALGPVTGRSRLGPMEAVQDLGLEIKHWNEFEVFKNSQPS